MAGCSLVVGRRLTVCARNKCWKCQPEEDIVPDDCEFEILHVLETGLGEGGERGVQEFDRQTGKSRRLVEYANYIVKGGYRVYFLVMNRQAGERLKSPPYSIDPKVFVISQQEAVQKLSGLAPGYLISDELDLNQLKDLRWIMDRHTLIAAWYTDKWK